MKTLKQFQHELNVIEKDFIKNLRSKGLQLSDNAVCNISSNEVVIGVNYEKRKGYQMDFASDINIYCARTTLGFLKECEINFGSSGSFTPECKASYWRTIHATEILNNWESVCNIVNLYCRQYDIMIEDYHKNVEL